MAHFIGCNEYDGFSGYSSARGLGENTQNLLFSLLGEYIRTKCGMYLMYRL